ncbi:MAG TPA: YfcC family protein [Candidatus Onthocola stercorigallinarum]|nr:YfcC family protein [Candidatus Onthocola stercorigallinarum]
MKMAKRKKFMLSAFSIIFILIIILAIFSHILPDAQFVDGILVDGSGTVGAKLSDFLLSPILGFSDAVDVCVFILILGGFLAIINKTGALETGIKVLVKKLKGNEIVLIPILMFIFSVGGTTYGMLEETVGFYVLLAATMVAAGYDTIVGSAIVLLGAGSGVLGSTVNPFAVGVAVSSLPEGVTANQGLLIFTGLILWITTLLISIIFVMNYAKKVQEDKGSTFLSLQEQKAMEKKFIKEEDSKDKKKDVKLSIKQRITLILLGLTFVVMIIGFIPWGDFNVTIFDKFTGWLTGTSLGGWYFAEASVWFFVMAIIIGIINRFKEKEIVDTFVDGANDMIAVILIIAVARGASVLMGVTYLDNYIIYNSADLLSNLPELAFVPLNYLLHVVLSILVPSSSGLAVLSTPIMGGLASTLGYNVEVTIMTFVSANGLVNLITPTCGAIMGGLALAKVEYTTWFKWAFKIVLTIAVANILVLELITLVF